VRRPIRIATTRQLEYSVRAAGFETYLLPDLPSLDFNRSLEQRLRDGAVYEPFLRKHDIDLVLDYDTSALTFVPSPTRVGEYALTTAALGIPYVAFYIDLITATMAQVKWEHHWHLLENATWIKWITERVQAEELTRMGIPNIINLPMAMADGEFDTGPLPEPDPGPAVAFMGHPASSWFRSSQSVLPGQLFAGLLAAGVRADMPDVPFHKIYYDLYQLGELPQATDPPELRARKALQYFNAKFVYNAYLAIKQRDRWARYLQLKLGDAFELIGDFWQENYGLKHTPKICDQRLLHERMRRVPICLNLLKGGLESGMNLRHLEITAHGGFMLTYPSLDLPHFFEVGKECAVFTNEQELMETIAYYLEHDRERREIAAAGQRRTLSEHLLSHRVVRLVEMLQQGGVLPKGLRAAPPATSTPQLQVTLTQ